MEGFDTMAMPSYLASPLSLGNMQGADYLSTIPGMDLHDQHSNFDSETFVSGDDLSFPQRGSLPVPLNGLTSGYEGPFADMMSQFEPTAPEPNPESSVDRNNKLLGFSMPVYNFALLDYSLRRASLSLSAQLHGMFFLAESPWTMSPDENAPPEQGAELTCYRRNLFQITGSVTIPRGLRYIMTDQGDRIPILAQELTVSATESVEGNSVKIISVPWKTPAANNGSSVEENNPKVEREPPPIPLDTMAGQDLDTDYATFPIAWKRLQFRVATANNGRRKELQQHFVVRLKVVATLSTGAKIPVCEVQSGPVIVRGRSPRNFQSRKDLPLSGSAASSRKIAQGPTSGSINRPSTAASVARSSKGAAKGKTGTKRSSPDASVPQGSSTSQEQPSPDWVQLPQSSPEQPRTTEPQRNSSITTAPISLSLSDDEDGGGNGVINAELNSTKPTAPPSKEPSQKPVHNNNNHNNHNLSSSAPPAKIRKLSHSMSQRSRAPSSSLPLFSASALQQTFAPSIFSNESADMLYEYFPLGLDDWQPPVDAVYRPHVVHHTNIPDMKFVAGRGRSKRYFAAEDVF